MQELTVFLDPGLGQALGDLADATGLPPEEIAREAVRRYVDAEAARVLAAGERLASAHAELLRRLGE
ncbi:hypothetical protein AB0E88_02410 [Streptomyces sp. NPDC028635]|uniref:hypothetical protein n=1 Tax=Streptomyces sp. NPDC028635 TaxID=3154800 RepID=UPI003406F721